MTFVAHIEGKLTNDLPITQDLEAPTEEAAREQAKLYVEGLGEMLAESNVTIDEKPRFVHREMAEIADMIVKQTEGNTTAYTADQVDAAINAAGEERMFGSFGQPVERAREEAVDTAADQLLDFLVDDGKLPAP